MNEYGKKDEREALRRDPDPAQTEGTPAARRPHPRRGIAGYRPQPDLSPAVRGPRRARGAGFRDSETLAELLGCDPKELRRETVPKRRPMKRKRPRPLPRRSPANLPRKSSGWGWPVNMIRYESGAAPLNAPLRPEGVLGVQEQRAPLGECEREARNIIGDVQHPADELQPAQGGVRVSNSQDQFPGLLACQASALRHSAISPPGADISYDKKGGAIFFE